MFLDVAEPSGDAADRERSREQLAIEPDRVEQHGRVELYVRAQCAAWVALIEQARCGRFDAACELQSIASTELSPVPSVSTVNGADPLTASVDDACPVTLPGEAEVKTIVH